MFRKVISALEKYMRETHINRLLYRSAGVSMGVLLTGLFLGIIIFGDPLPDIFLGCLLILVLGLIGSNGIASIIKQEAPRKLGPTLKGPLAVFEGWVILVIFSILIIVMIFNLFR